MGTSLALQRSSNSLGSVITMSIAPRFGSVVVVAYGVAIRVIDVLQAFTAAVQRAASIMIGQNIGAEKYDRAWGIARIAMLSIFTALLIGPIGIYLAREQPVAVFVPDLLVVKEGSLMISVFARSIPFFGPFFIAGAIATGSGYTRFSAFISILRLWLLRIGLSVLLALAVNMGSIGIYYAVAIGNIVSGLPSLGWIYARSWLRKII